MSNFIQQGPASMDAFYQEYPLVMKHPHHAAATMTRGPIDPKMKDMPAAFQNPDTSGTPERFPNVTVNTKDQEQYYAAQGYVRAGQGDPKAYERSRANLPVIEGEIIEYPKWKYHATQDAKVVDTPEQEKTLGSGWVDHPDLLKAAPIDQDKPIVQKPLRIAKKSVRKAKKAKKKTRTISDEARQALSARMRAMHEAKRAAKQESA